MTEKQEISYELVTQSSFDGGASMLTRSAKKAASLLMMWRSQVMPSNDVERVSKDYEMTDENHIKIDSEAPSEVEVSYEDAEHDTTIYRFDSQAEELTVVKPGSPEPVKVLDVTTYEAFSRILFDCGRIEMRQP